MRKKLPVLLVATVLLGAVPAFANGNSEQWKEKRAEKIDQLVTDATDTSGNVTQASLESAMEKFAKDRADKLFAKLSASGQPVTAAQLSSALNEHGGFGHRANKSNDDAEE